MSRFMQTLLKKNAEKSEKVQKKLQGQSYLYMGDPALNWGTGGWVRGKVNLTFGPHKSGKTTLCLIAAGAEQTLQSQAGIDSWVVIHDSEYAHNDPNETDVETGKLTDRAKEAKQRYEACGINVDRLVIISSNRVDELFGPLPEFEKQCREGTLNIAALIVDSWAGVQGESANKKIEEGELATAGNSFGGNAKTLGPILQTILRLSAENAITTFIIQHCIQNMEQYGPRWVLLGGEKLKYLVHMVLFVEFTQDKEAGLFDGDQVGVKDGVRIGKKIRFQCQKSRKVVEGRSGEFYIDFKNIRFAKPENSLFDLATKLGVIDHPRTVVADKDGNPIPNKKTGELEYKTNNMYWEFPAGAPSAVKFHGEKGCVDELRNNKEFYNQVLESCNNTDKVVALPKGEAISNVSDK